MNNNKKKLNFDSFGKDQELETNISNNDREDFGTSPKVNNSKFNKFKSKRSKTRNKFKNKRDNSISFNKTFKLTDRTDSFISPSSGLFIDKGERINIHSVQKVAFRVNDNKCLDSPIFDGYLNQFVSRYLSDRGLQNLDYDINEIVEMIKVVRNASFEAYAAILSFSRKYSVGKLKDYRGSGLLGESFARDLSHTTRNTPTLADLSNQDDSFIVYDYLTMKISKAIWAQNWQSRFYNFYLTKDAIDNCHDIFENYIEINNNNLNTIYLDCFPEPCIGDYLGRIIDLENYLNSEVYSKFPYIRQIMEGINYKNLKEYAYTILNDVSRTTLRVKSDKDNRFSAATYNWPNTWSIYYEPKETRVWNNSPGYNPEPNDFGIFDKVLSDLETNQTIAEYSDILLKNFQEDTEKMGVMFAGTNAINCFNAVTNLYETWRQDKDVNKYKTSLEDYFIRNKSGCKSYFNQEMIESYNRLHDYLDSIKSKAEELIYERLQAGTGGIISGRSQRFAMLLAKEAAKAAAPGPLGTVFKALPTAVNYAGPALYAASQVGKLWDKFRSDRKIPSAEPLKPNPGESDQEFQDRVSKDYTFEPQPMENMTSEIYSLKYSRENHVFSFGALENKFDTNLFIEEFANLDRFRLYRPTCHGVCTYYHNHNEVELQNNQVIIPGIFSPNESSIPYNANQIINFTYLMNDNTSETHSHIFRGVYIGSSRNEPKPQPEPAKLTLKDVEAEIAAVAKEYLDQMTYKKIKYTDHEFKCMSGLATKVMDPSKFGNGEVRSQWNKNFVTGTPCYDVAVQDRFKTLKEAADKLELVNSLSISQLRDNTFNDGLIASCGSPQNNNYIYSIEDMNCTRIKENLYYREICKIAVFHKSIASDVLTGLKGEGSIGVRIV